MVEAVVSYATLGLAVLSTMGVGWLALRLRSRGYLPRPTAADIMTRTSGAHVHEFAEVNPAKYGDGRWHCGVCGEAKPEED